MATRRTNPCCFKTCYAATYYDDSLLIFRWARPPVDFFFKTDARIIVTLQRQFLINNAPAIIAGDTFSNIVVTVLGGLDSSGSVGDKRPSQHD